MKKFLFPALALGLVLTSCQSDEPFAPGAGEEVQASFTISVPDAMGTRAAEHSSAEGGFTNREGRKLNYTVALLNQDNKVMYSETCQSDGETATFHPTVVQGYTYKVVAYATFGNAVAPSATANNEVFDDNDALASIATLKGISDESEDAYYCFDTEVKGGKTMNVTLKRPFGKLRLVATDYDKLKALGTDVASVKVTYGENVVMETHFNAMAEVFGGQATSKEFEANKPTYSEDATNELTVFTDYLPASKTDETMYPFTIVTTYTNGETYTRTFAQDIPVKRNYLTTLRGNFFTTEAALTLTVDEMFENPAVNIDIWDGKTTTTPEFDQTANNGEGAYIIDSAADLAGLAALVNGTAVTPNPAPTRADANGTYNFVLTSNIDLGGYQWTPIGTLEKPYIGAFYGKGHTISNLKIVETEAKEGKAYIGFIGYAENVTIKDLTFDNVNINIPCLDIDHSQGHIGAVAGSLEGTSTIENVTVKGDITVYATQTANGASRVAVVAGGNTYGNVTMKNVHVVAKEGSYLKANNNTGALAGQLQGKSVFENCSSNIDVTVNKFFAGGLIGLAAGDQLFKDCHTTGDVAVVAGRSGKAHDHYRVGGIAGGWADGAKNVCTLIDCSYTGELTGVNTDGSVAETFDYWGYVGRGYTLNGCQGSKVVIDGTEFVQKYNTADKAGIYTINGCTPVSTADELVAALEANEGVYLLNDIKIDPASMSNAYGKTGVLVYNGQTIYGNGFKLDVKGAGGTWDSGICTSGGLIKDLWVTGGFRGIFVKGADHIEKVVLENVRVEGTTYTISIDQASGQGLEATNSIFRGWTSYAGTIGNVKFTDCTFGAGNGYNFSRPYAPTEYVGCNFEEGHKMDPRAAVTFENCTINGVALTAENVSTLVTSNIDKATVK